MTSTLTVQAKTALSPEWDHGFDEAFTDLVTSDPDLVQEEFDALIGANFTEPPESPTPPAPPAGQPPPPQPPQSPAGTAKAPLLAGTTDRNPAKPVTQQRSPP